MSGRAKIVVWAAVLVLLVVAAYMPALRGGFVWDDDDYVTNNSLLFAADGLRRIWFSLDSPSQYFPLVYTVFRLEMRLWDLHPFGYHLVNVLLHAMNALLLWRLLLLLEIPGAWLAAAFFALHPVQVESVAWITELKNVLSTFFGLLAVGAWLRFSRESSARRLPSYLLALLFFALALFSKTTAVIVPGILLILSWYRGERIGWRKVGELVPFVVMGVGMGLVSVWWERYHQGTQGTAFAFSPAQRLLIAGRALWFYLAKLLWPSRLAFSYPRWRLNTGDPLQWLWPSGVVAAAAGLWYAGKRFGRGPAAAALFYVVCLAPMLGFVALYTFMYAFVADHYQYVAAIGPLTLLAAVLSRPRRTKATDTAVRLVLPAAILGVLFLLTWRQSGAYRNAETLWRDVVVKYPSGSWLARNNLTELLFLRGDNEAALVQMEAALADAPYDPVVQANYGKALYKVGRVEESVPYLRAALRALPDYLPARIYLESALKALDQVGLSAGDPGESRPPPGGYGRQR